MLILYFFCWDDYSVAEACWESASGLRDKQELGKHRKQRENFFFFLWELISRPLGRKQGEISAANNLFYILLMALKIFMLMTD